MALERRHCICSSEPFQNWLSGVQFIEQNLSLFQIERVEAFGEPAVDRSEKVAGLMRLPLATPELRHAHRRAKVPSSSVMLTASELQPRRRRARSAFASPMPATADNIVRVLRCKIVEALIWFRRDGSLSLVCFPRWPNDHEGCCGPKEVLRVSADLKLVDELAPSRKAEQTEGANTVPGWLVGA